jgi:hypothetical protein
MLHYFSDDKVGHRLPTLTQMYGEENKKNKNKKMFSVGFELNVWRGKQKKSKKKIVLCGCRTVLAKRLPLHLNSPHIDVQPYQFF